MRGFVEAAMPRFRRVPPKPWELGEMHHPSTPSAMVDFNDLEWFDCRIESAGPGEDGTIWVNMSDTAGTFSQVWFIALAAIRQQVLETALAALQSKPDCHV